MATKEEILKYWFEEEHFYQSSSVCAEPIQSIYYRMTKEWGEKYEVSGKGTRNYEEKMIDENLEFNKTCKYEDLRKVVEEKKPIVTLNSPNNSEIYHFFQDAIVLMRVGNSLLYWFAIYTHKREIAEKWQKAVVWSEEEKRESNNYCYANISGYTKIVLKSLKFQKFETDIKKNYNDDLPITQIVDFLKNDDSGLILLHGEPGTGKSSFLKHLISISLDKKFVIIPKELFSMAGQESFIDFFGQDCGERVYVLEDCEKILMKREKGASLETILNMSDGLLGSSFKTKFICSFNTDLGNIDKALLRKGRLKVRYEFKKLTLEKTKALKGDATKPMTLAEIYNPEDNGGEKNEGRKLGF